VGRHHALVVALPRYRPATRLRTGTQSVRTMFRARARFESEMQLSGEIQSRARDATLGRDSRAGCKRISNLDA